MRETTDEQTGSEHSADSTGTSSQWLTALVAVGGLLAAALLGAAGGILLTAPDGGDGSRPNAVDVGFAQDMAAHHRQGVRMAAVVRQRSDDPEIRQIAMDIAHTQTEQMGRMRGWLGLWSQPPRPTGVRMSWMNGTHRKASTDPVGSDPTSMPGMASDAELDRLRSLSGRELDIYFLQLMIRHHQGGGPMMREAIERAEVAEVGNLAGQMRTAQTAEVGVMQRMLAERGAQPLPTP